MKMDVSEESCKLGVTYRNPRYAMFQIKFTWVTSNFKGLKPILIDINVSDIDVPTDFSEFRNLQFMTQTRFKAVDWGIAWKFMFTNVYQLIEFYCLNNDA
jgi:hypothetical protein